MKEAFFKATENSFSRITEIFDLVHPITLSVWNMKSEILGIKQMYPEITETKLHSRYNIASIVHGVNYKRSFIENDWNSFEESLAWILLNNIFAIYEGWLSELHTSVFSSTPFELNEKSMQFPTTYNASSQPIRGFHSELAKLTATESSLTKSCFYNSYKTKKHYSSVPIDNLLYCYRYFKEMRNCFTHNGIIASNDLINAYNDFLPYASSTLLGVQESPEYFEPILNQKIKISLRGVIGFSEIVLKLLVTCDAELLRSTIGEQYFLERLKAAPINIHVFNSNPAKALEQAARCCVKAGFVRPVSPNLIKDFLLLHHIVSL